MKGHLIDSQLPVCTTKQSSRSHHNSPTQREVKNHAPTRNIGEMVGQTSHPSLLTPKNTQWRCLIRYLNLATKIDGITQVRPINIDDAFPAPPINL